MLLSPTLHLSAFSDDGRVGISLTSQEHVSLWWPSTGDTAWIEACPKLGYDSLALSDDGERFAVGCTGGEVVVGRIASPHEAVRWPTPYSVEMSRMTLDAVDAKMSTASAG